MIIKFLIAMGIVVLAGLALGVFVALVWLAYLLFTVKKIVDNNEDDSHNELFV